MDLAGQVVGAKWQLLSRLGEGTFGDVWVARHVVTGRQKALKLLHASYSSSAEATERFVREAQAAARIDSPHVVGVDDIGHDDRLRRAYLVMELLRGESLYDYLVRAPFNMKFGEAIVVLRQVAAALEAAHASGIVHRDLKPENVFLSWRSEGTVLVKVLDFGIAKLVHSQAPAPATLDGAGLRRARTVGFVGTVGYASPEQIRDSASVGVAADIFALGVCSFEMLTGTSYWRAEEHDDLVDEIRRGIVQPASARAPVSVDLPPEYDAWFARACAHDPAARFPSASKAINALEDALGQHDPLKGPGPRSNVHKLLETTGRFRFGNSSGTHNAVSLVPDMNRGPARAAVGGQPAEASAHVLPGVGTDDGVADLPFAPPRPTVDMESDVAAEADARTSANEDDGVEVLATDGLSDAEVPASSNVAVEADGDAHAFDALIRPARRGRMVVIGVVLLFLVATATLAAVVMPHASGSANVNVARPAPVAATEPRLPTTAPEPPPVPVGPTATDSPPSPEHAPVAPPTAHQGPEAPSVAAPTTDTTGRAPPHRGDATPRSDTPHSDRPRAATGARSSTTRYEPPGL